MRTSSRRWNITTSSRRAHRHFGFFWCPTEAEIGTCTACRTPATSSTGRTSDVCEMKVMDITDAPPSESQFEKVAYSSDVYPITYVPNFHELEYAVPVEQGRRPSRRYAI